jgi:hypothetical protein
MYLFAVAISILLYLNINPVSNYLLPAFGVGSGLSF